MCQCVSVSLLSWSTFTAGMAGGKYRSFLVHIKAVSDRGVEENPRPVLKIPCAKPQGTKAHSLSTLLQRAQASKVQTHSLLSPESEPGSDSTPPTAELQNLEGIYCDLSQTFMWPCYLRPLFILSFKNYTSFCKCE